MSPTADLLIALHGNFGQPGDWDAVVQALGAVGAVGDSDRAAREAPQFPKPTLHQPCLWDWAEAELDFDAVAQRLVAMAEAARAEGRRAWLAGYSLGGRLALHALVRRPELWSGAVILSSHPGLASPAERSVRLQRDAAWARRVRDEPWHSVLEAWNAQAVFAADGPPDAGAQRSLEGWRAAVATAFELWSLGRQDDLRPALARCRVPVLWVTGGEDRVFTALGAESAALLPEGRHEILEGLGHRLLGEAARLAPRLARWWRRHQG